jgi:hypothetical protein
MCNRFLDIGRLLGNGLWGVRRSRTLYLMVLAG